jgi:hypothetical protein
VMGWELHCVLNNHHRLRSRRSHSNSCCATTSTPTARQFTAQPNRLQPKEVRTGFAAWCPGELIAKSK